MLLSTGLHTVTPYVTLNIEHGMYFAAKYINFAVRYINVAVRYINVAVRCPFPSCGPYALHNTSMAP